MSEISIILSIFASAFCGGIVFSQMRYQRAQEKRLDKSENDLKLLISSIQLTHNKLTEQVAVIGDRVAAHEFKLSGNKMSVSNR